MKAIPEGVQIAAEVAARAVDRLADNRVEVVGALYAVTINLVGH
jgi:hypothetical protein